mmetsp:Transcript_983/g.1641  ORF Transcript_983/g.1641 Transcript_983/m.1641 type:complete len:84 (-) Transcript_983:42-293(-)
MDRCGCGTCGAAVRLWWSRRTATFAHFGQIRPRYRCVGAIGIHEYQLRRCACRWPGFLKGVLGTVANAMNLWHVILPPPIVFC